MLGKKIIIIGGSIAGCTAAILLKRLGAKVIILERSAGRITTGSGITLPESLVNQCITLDLFDADITRFPIKKRSFTHKYEHTTHDQRTFWIQPYKAVSLNWASVYQNLRARTSGEDYYSNTNVSQIVFADDRYLVETTLGRTYEADIIIAADGVDSTTRAHILPDSCPKYAEYIAWRGVIDDQSIVGLPLFNEHAPYFFSPNGHILFYRIPSVDYQSTGRTMLNWVMYENRKGLPLGNLLIDKNGVQHSRSLPAGSLTEEHINYLNDLSRSILPRNIANLVIQTPMPFIQAVFDFQIPDYPSNNIIFIGDAAATLRPHSASGVLKALQDGIELKNLFENSPKMIFTDIISAWKNLQKEMISTESRKSKIMGHALVTGQPNWHVMDQQLTSEWWSELMRGESWYATCRTSKSSLIETSIFKPENKEEDASIIPHHSEQDYKR